MRSKCLWLRLLGSAHLHMCSVQAPALKLDDRTTLLCKDLVLAPRNRSQRKTTSYEMAFLWLRLLGSNQRHPR